MSAILDDPYLLSSYSIDVAYCKSTDRFNVATTSLVRVEDREEGSQLVKGKRSSLSNSNGNSRSSSAKSIAVTTVQRSAVHLVDTSDQSPLSSFTISPSVAFTTPAVSVSYPSPAATADDEELGVPSTSLAGQHTLRTRKTFVGVFLEEGSHELWCWTEQEKRDGTAVGEAVKSVHELQTSPLSISVSALEGHVLISTADGLISVYDLGLELVSRSTIAPSNNAGEKVSKTILQAALPTDKLPFLRLTSTSASIVALPVIAYSSPAVTAPASTKKSSKTSKRGRIIPAEDANPSATEQSSKRSARIVFLLANAADPKELVQAAAFDVPGDDIIDIAFSAMQNLVIVLNRDGQTTVHSLSAESSSLRSADDLLAEAMSTSPIALQATAQKQLVFATDTILIPEARLLPLRPSQSSATRPSSSTFLLLAAPKKTEQSKSILLLLIDARYGLIIAEQDIAIPSTTSSSEVDAVQPVIDICQIDGFSLALSSPVVSTSDSIKRVSVYSIPSTVPVSSTLANLIGKQALTVKYTKAAQAEERPINAEEDMPPHLKLLADLSRHLTSNKDTRDTKAAEAVWNDWRAIEAGEMPTMPSSTASRIIKLCVQPNLSVPTAIVQSLLLHGLVDDGSVVAPGLTAILVANKSWSLVNKALFELEDVPESTLVEIVRTSVAMEEKTLDTEFIVKIVSRVIDSSVTPAALRSALHRQLNIDEVSPLLYLINAWLSGELALSAPDIDKLVTFTQCLFDAHLVSILQEPSLGQLVVEMQGHLSAHIALCNTMSQLKGPLDALTQAYEAMELSKKERKEQQSKEKTKDKKVNGAVAGASTAAAGKSDGSKKLPWYSEAELAEMPRAQRKNIMNQRLADPQERWAMKQKLMEERMLVGEYTVEYFKL